MDDGCSHSCTWHLPARFPLRDLDSPPVGRCNICNRVTYDQSAVSSLCLFPQPDGTRCCGKFYQMLQAQVPTQGWEEELLHGRHGAGRLGVDGSLDNRCLVVPPFAERPLVPKMSLSTLFPHWPVYTPFEALDAWSSTANKLERGRAPRWSWYGPMDPGTPDLIRRGFLRGGSPWTTFFSLSRPY